MMGWSVFVLVGGCGVGMGGWFWLDVGGRLVGGLDVVGGSRGGGMVGGCCGGVVGGVGFALAVVVVWDWVGVE